MNTSNYVTDTKAMAIRVILRDFDFELEEGQTEDQYLKQELQEADDFQDEVEKISSTFKLNSCRAFPKFTDKGFNKQMKSLRQEIRSNCKPFDLRGMYEKP